MRAPGYKLALLVAAITACGGMLARHAAADTPPVAAAAFDAGRKIYNFRCYFCHGYSGNAQTVAASFLNPPPIDFTRAAPARYTQEHIVFTLKNGKPGTAMQSFRSVLNEQEMEQVAAFVVDKFVRRKAPNTLYHTPENGWQNHQRYRTAFPFATGEIPIDRPWNQLTAEQRHGKRLFLSSCVICHDRGRATGDTAIWETTRVMQTPSAYSRN